MERSLRLLIALAPAVSLACSSDPGKPGPGDPFDTTAAAQKLATAQCGFTARCEPALLLANKTDMNGCISEVQANLKESFDFVSPVVAVNRAAFRSDKLDACVSELASVDCDLGITDHSPCSDFITGMQPLDAPCGLTLECVSGAFCARGGLGTCGTCKAAAAVGAPCPDGACVRGSICVDVGMNAPDFKCVPNDAEENAQCLTVETGLCRGKLQCVGSQMPYTCKRPAAVDAPCDPQLLANPDCDNFMNNFCDGGTCKAGTWVDSGMCGGATMCTGESYCPMGQCTALPGPGSSCMETEGVCATGAYCNGSGMCQALKASGMTCTSGFECADGLECVGSGASGTCSTYNWTQCN